MSTSTSAGKSKLLIVCIVAAIVAVAGVVTFMMLDEKPGSNNLTIDKADTVIDGGTYNDVVIAPSVGDGNVVLKNLKINGKLIVNGGGSHSITLSSCEIGGSVEVNKVSGEAPRIFADSTTLTNVSTTSNMIIETAGSGTVKNLTVSDSKVTVKGELTRVENVSSSGNTTLIVSDTATVSSVNQSAGKLTVDGSGTISKVSANDTQLVIKGADTKVSSVETSGNTEVSVTDDAHVTVLKQNSGSLSVSGSGTVSTLEARGDVEADSATVSMIRIEDVSDNASIRINGDEKIDIALNTEKTIYIAAESAEVSIGALDGINANASLNGGEIHIHKLVEVVERKSTCTVSGVKYYTCSDGDGYRSEPVLLELLPHTPSEPVRENHVAATYFAPGSYDEVVRCSECGTILSIRTVKLDKLEAPVPPGSSWQCTSVTIYNIGGTTVSFEGAVVNMDGSTAYRESSSLVSLTVADETYSETTLFEFLSKFELDETAIDGMKYVRNENGKTVSYSVTTSTVSDRLLTIESDNGNTRSCTCSEFMTSWNLMAGVSDSTDAIIQKKDVRIANDNGVIEDPDGVPATKCDAKHFEIGFYIYYKVNGQTIDSEFYLKKGGDTYVIDRELKINDGLYECVSAKIGNRDVPIGETIDVTGDIHLELSKINTARVEYACDGEVIYSQIFRIGEADVSILDRYATKDHRLYKTVSCPDGYETGTPFVMPDHDLKVNVRFTESHCIHYVDVDGNHLKTEYCFEEGYPILIEKNLTIGIGYITEGITDGIGIGVPTPMPGHDVTVTVHDASRVYIYYCCDGEIISRSSFPVNTYGYIQSSVVKDGRYFKVNVPEGITPGIPFYDLTEDRFIEVFEVPSAHINYMCDGELVFKATYPIGETVNLHGSPVYKDTIQYFIVSMPEGYNMYTDFIMPDHDFEVEVAIPYDVNIIYTYQGKEIYRSTFKSTGVAYYQSQISTDDGKRYRANLPEGISTPTSPVPKEDQYITCELIETAKIYYVCNGETIQTDTMNVGDQVILPQKIYRKTKDVIYQPQSISGNYSLNESFIMPASDLTVTVSPVPVVHLILQCDGVTVNSTTYLPGDQFIVHESIFLGNTTETLVVYRVIEYPEEYSPGETHTMPDHDVVFKVVRA